MRYERNTPTMNDNTVVMPKKEMTNASWTVKGDKLTITVDLSPAKGNDLQLSAKGKSYLVASSHSWQNLENTKFDDVSFSLNVNIPKKEYESARNARLAPKPETDASKQSKVVKGNQKDGSDNFAMEAAYKYHLDQQSAQIAQLTALVAQLLAK